MHQPLDVFHHHDGVIHQQADRQHHAKHGQRIDRVTEGRQHAKGPQQHHRHRQCRDQRGPEVLQKQVHHRKHQHNRFHQRTHHVFDRQANEWNGVIGIHGFHSRREEGFQLRQRGTHRLRGLQRIGTGCQTHAQPDRRIAVVVAINRVVLRAQLNARHVGQANPRTVRIGFQQDLAELLRGLQA
ncbi:hypothetical protein D3C80_632770 [compost metagenome]